jgi:hypothetical protein
MLCLSVGTSLRPLTNDILSGGYLTSNTRNGRIHPFTVVHQFRDDTFTEAEVDAGWQQCCRQRCCAQHSCQARPIAPSREHYEERHSSDCHAEHGKKQGGTLQTKQRNEDEASGECAKRRADRIERIEPSDA